VTAARPATRGRAAVPGAFLAFRRWGWRDDVAAALVPWLVSRALVVGALVVAREVVDDLGVGRPLQLDQGMLGWDAAFYADIARHGYDALPADALRFFPLLPLLARFVAVVPGPDTDFGVVAIANVAALAFAVVLHRLVRHETGDGALARRSVWFALVVPYAFTLVMGYAESLLLLASVVAFLGLRTRRFELAAAAGALAGLSRPVGVLLAVPAAVEVLRDRAGLRRPAELARRGLAVAGPGLGALAYLIWSRSRAGGLFGALELHSDPEYRGALVDPVSNLVEAAGELLSGEHLGAGVHVLTALVFAALLVPLARRLAPSYAVYAGAALVVGLTGDNLGSFERYALSAFPFVVAAALVVRAGWFERAVLTASAGALVALSVLAFTGSFVP
jgi:hypothetical protein